MLCPSGNFQVKPPILYIVPLGPSELELLPQPQASSWIPLNFLISFDGNIYGDGTSAK
jgi:hypothetical protein